MIFEYKHNGTKKSFEKREIIKNGYNDDSGTIHIMRSSFKEIFVDFAGHCEKMEVLSMDSDVDGVINVIETIYSFFYQYLSIFISENIEKASIIEPLICHGFGSALVLLLKSGNLNYINKSFVLLRLLIGNFWDLSWIVSQDNVLMILVDMICSDNDFDLSEINHLIFIMNFFIQPCAKFDPTFTYIIENINLLSEELSSYFSIIEVLGFIYNIISIPTLETESYISLLLAVSCLFDEDSIRKEDIIGYICAFTECYSILLSTRPSIWKSFHKIGIYNSFLHFYHYPDPTNITMYSILNMVTSYFNAISLEEFDDDKNIIINSTLQEMTIQSVVQLLDSSHQKSVDFAISLIYSIAKLSPDIVLNSFQIQYIVDTITDIIFNGSFSSKTKILQISVLLIRASFCLFAKSLLSDTEFHNACETLLSNEFYSIQKEYLVFLNTVLIVTVSQPEFHSLIKFKIGNTSILEIISTICMQSEEREIISLSEHILGYFEEDC